MIFTGSKYPKNICFEFENKITDGNWYMRRRMIVSTLSITRYATYWQRCKLRWVASWEVWWLYRTSHILSCKAPLRGFRISQSEQTQQRLN